MAYHDNLYWRECEAIRALEFIPKDVQNEIIKYCYKTYKMDRILTEEDVDDVKWLLDNYDCVLVRYKQLLVRYKQLDDTFTLYREIECRITSHHAEVVDEIYRDMKIYYENDNEPDLFHYNMRCQTLSGLYLRVGRKKAI